MKIGGVIGKPSNIVRSLKYYLMAYLKDAILCGGSIIHDAVQAFLHSENYSGIG